MNSVIQDAADRGKIEGREFANQLKTELGLSESEYMVACATANSMMEQIERLLELFLARFGAEATTKILTYVFKFQLEGARRACEIAKESSTADRALSPAETRGLVAD